MGADVWCAVAWGPLVESKMSTKLVLEFLQHHGHLKAAEAFAKACGLAGLSEEEIDVVHKRQQLAALVMAGDIDATISSLTELFPTLLNKVPQLRFELRCLQFVEMVPC